MRELDELFTELAKSDFRSRQRLNARDAAQLRNKPLDTLLDHALHFLTHRLAAAQPQNDGHQTPMRGHPVFVAQHATGTCCRDCLARWHRIPKGRPLTDTEIDYLLGVIWHWLQRQMPLVKAGLSPSPESADSHHIRQLTLFDK